MGVSIHIGVGAATSMIIDENEEDPESDDIKTIHHRQQRVTSFTLPSIIHSSNSYVTRIGVINKLGWLLTLTSGPPGGDAGHYQQIDKQEESLGDNHEYEEVLSDEENNNNIHSVKNNNLRTEGGRPACLLHPRHNPHHL